MANKKVAAPHPGEVLQAVDRLMDRHPQPLNGVHASDVANRLGTGHTRFTVAPVLDSLVEAGKLHRVGVLQEVGRGMARTIAPIPHYRRPGT